MKITAERMKELCIEAELVCTLDDKIYPNWLDSVDLTPYVERLTLLVNKEIEKKPS